MSVPTDLEISSGRADLAAALWERCTLRRRPAPDQPFQTIEGGEDVPCRLAPRGGQVGGVQVLSAADPHGEFTLSLPAGTDVGDEKTVEGLLQALVTSRLHAGARRFEATYVEPRQAFLMRVRGTVEG
jgi:hypothetical protein